MIKDNGDGTVTYTRLPKAALDVLDPVAKAVDDYLLMERKARAWDELRVFAEKTGQFGLVAQMDTFVHPAQDAA